MKRICLFLLLATATSLLAQSPVKETLAYSRSTLPGIPGAAASQNPLPTSYFIYVVVQKGAAVSIRGVCLKGEWRPGTGKRVASPVQVDRDVSVPTGQKETLVKATSDDVYQVELRGPNGRPCGARARAAWAEGNDVVVCLESGGSRWYGLASKIVPLHPAAAP